MEASDSRRLTCVLLGAVGSIAPDIVLFYSKRFTMPDLQFSPMQYVLATVLYMVLAGVVAAIYPYRGRPSPWKAFGIGVALPLIVSALASTQRPGIISPRGFSVPGELIDLISLF